MADFYNPEVQQIFPDSCAIKSQQLILSDFGIEVSEVDLVQTAAVNGWYNGGTAPQDVGNLLELANIPVTRQEGANVFNLVNELAQGHKVIVGLDANEMWHNDSISDKLKNWYNDFFGEPGGNHALIVAGIDTSDPNNILVIVKDPGSGDDGKPYPLDQFIDAWSDANCYMVSTDMSAPEFAEGMQNFDQELGHYVSNPDQTVYSSYDELDFTGAYLTVAENGDFDNAEEYFLTDLIAEGLVTVDASEYNSEHGLHKIYFTYEGKTDSITVTVAPIDVPDVHDIVSVNTQNMKTEYRVGEELDLTGALFGASKYRYGIVGHFDQCNLLEYVEKGMLEVEATDFDNETPGTYTIYVTYGLDTTSFDVTVKGKRVIPSGDSNGDGKFTVADVVTMQSYIMGKKTAKLSDWRNVDFCEDGQIDVFDFIVMRENYIENMENE